MAPFRRRRRRSDTDHDHARSIERADAGSLALIDCGNDERGKALLAELERRKLPRDAVKAIFVTHGHPDHITGCPLFPAAQIYALETERDVIEGREKPHGPVTKLIPAPLQVTVFAVPGHTRGSAAYLADGVLYLGDSADAKKDGTLVGSKYWFSDDKEQNQASLHALATRLASRADEIKTLAFAHTGVLTGFAPLRDFRQELSGRRSEALRAGGEASWRC